MFYVYRLRSVSCLRNINRNLFGKNLSVNTVTNFHFRTHNTTSDKNTEIMAAKMTQPSSTSVTHTNRLLKEKSPYLLQHAHNPVDWYPWGDEAIQKAKQENKLIFLSVGYSTCHWCHVMEKESFEDEEVAKLMNDNYINIKVDREERPDIDKIYMMFVLMINGSGGWPMSVWLTPDLAPLTAGTYFPPNDRWGMPGFKSILSKIALKWKDNGPELTRTGHTVIQALKKNANEKTAENDNILTVEGKFNQCISIYKRNFDSEWGGFGRSPKFPEVSKLNLLLHAHSKQPKGKIAEIVLTTLNKIANGGIHDHVFGGFARYSVDHKWHVPHFEKMLYDQGQLLVVYSNAYRLTQNQLYLDICENIVKYISKDLKHPGGGFYSGEDADSLPKHSDTVKVEGAFYAWAYDEVEDAIKSNEKKFIITDDVDPFEIFSYHYDIQQGGNVEPSSDPQGHLVGKNILFVNGSTKDTAIKFKTDIEVVNHILKISNEILYEIRCKRPRPHLDTKIICAWNGLMLSGLSKLSCIDTAPKHKEYLELAKQLVEFVKTNLYNSETKTLIRSCYGEGTDSHVASNGLDPIPGFLDDYAFLIKGLLDYYVTTQDVDVLHWAVDLQNTQDELFWDKENGGYFYSQADAPNVIVRLKEDHDGAEPCGNSMAVHNLMYLNTYFEDHKYKDKAKEILNFFENSSPFGYVLPHMMSGLLLYDSGLELMVVVGPDNDDAKKLLKCVKNFFIPGLVPIQIKVDHPEQLTRKSALLFKMIKNLPTAYICHNQVCQLPVTTPEELTESLSERYLYK